MSLREILRQKVNALAEYLNAPIVENEVALSNESQYSRNIYQQYSPDLLVTKKGFDTYEAMYTTDDQINLCVSALKLVRLSTGYEIEAASEDPRDQEMADFVGDVLENTEGSVHNNLFSIMGALEMGWSLNEIIWKFYEDGPYKGRLGIKAIKSKNPKWFNPRVDEFSNPLEIISIASPSYGQKYPIDKFILYSFQKRYENVFGTARLRSLHTWWWAKSIAIKAMNIFVEKYGLPMPCGFYSKNFTKKEKDAFLASLQKFRIEQAIVLPDGTRVDFIEVMGKGTQAFLDIVEKADQQIAKVILGQTLTSSSQGNGQVGGNGGIGTLGQVQFDIFTMYIEYLGNDLSDGPLASLIKRIVDYNYSGVYKYPIFKFKPLKPEDVLPQITAFISTVQAGLVKPNPQDEAQIRKMLGFNNLATQKTKLRPNRYQNTPVLKVVTVSPTLAQQPSFMFAEKPSYMNRKTTQYEDKVDFAEIVRVQDDVVKTMSKQAVDVLDKMVAKLVSEIKKERIIEDTNVDAINKLDLMYKGDLKRVYQDNMERVAMSAMQEARREVRQSIRHADFSTLAPAEVLQFIKQKAFWMTDVTSSGILDTVKLELYNAVKMGKDYKSAVFSIEEALKPFIGQYGESIDVLTAPRLETTVRTNLSEAYNQARDAVFESPEMKDLVVAYQLSAVLDGQTRENHRIMDGRIYLVNDPIWKKWTPPNGFNCRCLKIPITKYEKFVVSEYPPQDVQPDKGFK